MAQSLMVYEHIDLFKLPKNTHLLLESEKDIFDIKILNNSKAKIEMEIGSTFRKSFNKKLVVKALYVGTETKDGELEDFISYNNKLVLEITYNKRTSLFKSGNIYYARIYNSDWSYELNWPNPFAVEIETKSNKK